MGASECTMGRKKMLDGYIGENIARLRNQKGWSQELFAAKLQVEEFDITRSTVAKIENGCRNIFAHELPMICRALGCRYEDLLGPERRPDESGE